MAFTTLLLLALAFTSVSGQTPHSYNNIQHSWGPYSPFFSVPSEISAATPSGCEITFAQVLSRHGARDPIHVMGTKFKALIDRIHASVTSYGRGYTFIKTYKYTLGTEHLTPLGQRELIDSGESFYKRYQKLAATDEPFIRIAGQERVINSGLYWKQGFYSSKVADGLVDHGTKRDIIIIPEAKGVNNTLKHGLCTAFEDDIHSSSGKAARGIWRDIFTRPIMARLNKNLPGADLTPADTLALMELCPFNTVVNGTISQFCNLFTPEEFIDYEYYETLDKYYRFHAGNLLGPTQGVGFTNELIARLTQKPVVDHTSTNSTLNADPATFPLNRKLYADFTHDNDMMGIYGALGLYSKTPRLSKTKRMSLLETKGFSSSRLVPFAARMYVEKMRCGSLEEEEEMVRVLINDRVVPLVGCGADELGRCRLSSFVESQRFARSGGLWDQCF
ncbi:acid phosphatase [Colletotrichum zoysiae]|uniref:Phytase A n=1 Tax=Colletotrichum zoysiae TaxID=1216348 RepID=A0AAD9H4Z2_9PEZI|nr:acid phosphatase [Colletotrichum zoysiae]